MEKNSRQVSHCCRQKLKRSMRHWRCSACNEPTEPVEEVIIVDRESIEYTAKLLKKENRALWVKMIEWGDYGSCGIEVCGNYRAWINYKPPYTMNGGNWSAHGESRDSATQNLYKKISEFRTKQRKICKEDQ